MAHSGGKSNKNPEKGKTMIYFFADNHYDAHPGRVLYEHLSQELQARTRFYEDQWEELENGGWEADCELLILNVIGGTCEQPHPGAGAEAAVRRYLESGRSALLLHGSSAAFWQWDWWRPLAGLRWVRPGDPDGVETSTHPATPCVVQVAKTRHPLAKRLVDFALPLDEVYINLEQTAPTSILMTTQIEQGTFPQCCETLSPWGGRLVSFIPGHKPECVSTPGLIADAESIINYLLEQ